MKISTGLLQLTTTQTEMAKALGISQQRVSQLLAENVVVTDDKGSVLVVNSLKNFYQSRTPASTEAVDYMEEKARHEKAKRELAEQKLAKLEGRLYNASTVELVMTEMLSNLRTQLLGLPAKLAPILDGRKKEEIYTTLTKEIEDKLMDLSEYTPELFTQELIEDEAGDES